MELRRIKGLGSLDENYDGDETLPPAPCSDNPAAGVDEDYDIESLQKKYPDDDDIPDDLDDDAPQTEMIESDTNIVVSKPVKDKIVFNYVRVEEISRNDDAVNKFISDTLIPALLDFSDSESTNKYDYSLIKFIHKLGCSVSFVFALADVFCDVSNALQIAVETSEERIVTINEDHRQAARLIEYYRKLFYKYDKRTIFAFNKIDKYNTHKEPLDLISYLTPLYKFDDIKRAKGLK
ncbi:MAG TPA: hypothetical protein VN514_00915 [Ignavibacteria bacterium]|nr:hypothetical protein [Ignavibacteria bacterium]